MFLICCLDRLYKSFEGSIYALSKCGYVFIEMLIIISIGGSCSWSEYNVILYAYDSYTDTDCNYNDDGTENDFNYLFNGIFTIIFDLLFGILLSYMFIRKLTKLIDLSNKNFEKKGRIRRVKSITIP